MKQNQNIKLYDESISKRYVQQKILDKISGIDSSILCLAGPTPKTYLDLLIKFVARRKENKIYSYEKLGFVLHTQLHLLYNTPKYQNKVIFNQGEIIQGKVQRVIDCDFCCTLETAQPTIEKLFSEQTNLFKNTQKRKAFCFTVSYMYKNIDNIVPFLEKLLQIKIKIDFIAKSKLCTEYLLKYNMNKYNISMYSYCDASPICVVLISYN